jgi:cell division septum initiation protein DivIVA
MQETKTPTQAYLESLNACPEARAWVGERTLTQAVAQCTRRDWLEWLAMAQHRAEYDRATAPHRAEFERAKAPHWAEYQRAKAQHLAEYDRAVAPHRAEYQRATAPHLAEYERAKAAARGADLDTLRAMITIPEGCA